MSESSKEADLASNEANCTIQDSSLNEETKKKEKRNFCYVCQIQCSGDRNFEDHKQGRKHSKKLSEIEAERKRKEKGKIAKTPKKVKRLTRKERRANEEQAKKLKLLKFAACTELSVSVATNETDESMASDPNNYNSSMRNYSKLDKDSSRNKYRYVNSNHDYHNRSNSHFENYPNHYSYNNQGYNANSAYSSFNNWISWQYTQAPHQNFNGYRPSGNIYPQYGVESQNAYSYYYDYNNSISDQPYSQSCSQTKSSENGNSSARQTSELHHKSDNAEGRHEERNINVKSLENGSNLDLNSCKDNTSSQRSASPDANQSVNSNDSPKESASTSAAIVVESNCSKQSSSPVPIISGKRIEKRRIRLRSLSSENNPNEKHTKEGIENQSTNSDTVADQQKIKEWTNTLLETNPGQISRLIHPSNYKDKAALNQLITNLAKSKRKENLTKLKSSSLGSNENLEGEESDIIEEDIDKIVESVISVSNNFSDLPSTESNSEIEQNTECRYKVKKKKKSSFGTNAESDVESITLNSSGELKVRKKSRFSSPTKDSASNISSNTISNISNEKDEDSITSATESGADKLKSPYNSEKSITLNNSGKLKCRKKSHWSSPIKDSISNISNEKDKDNITAEIESGADKLKSPYNSEKPLKRKSLVTKGKSKKHRCSSAESSEKNSEDQNSVQADVAILVNDVVVSSPAIAKPTNTADSSSVTLPVKAEVPESTAVELVDTTARNNQISLPSGLDLNGEITADTLMQLFATGSVKVKNEFYDPVIDAIKSVDPNELISACSSKSSQNSANETASKSMSDSSEKNSKDKSTTVSISSTSKGTANESSNMNQIILGSVTTSEDLSIVSNTQNSNLSLTNLTSNSQNVSSASNETDINATDNSLSFAKDMNLIPKDESRLSPSFQELIKELQDIALQEETVKKNIAEAKNKINDYQVLLDEWKNKKKKLHDDEEDLRKKRNDIIKVMQEAFKPSSETKDESDTQQKIMDTSSVPVGKISGAVSDDAQCQQQVQTIRKEKFSDSPKSSKSMKALSKQNNATEPPEISESDEITVLPVPIKVPIVIDLDDGEDGKVVQVNSDNTNREMFTNMVSSTVQSMFDVKEITGHSATVNCIVVFEGFLYTCSNDSTAKRFSLKDPTKTVVYIHTAKNVLEIVVEKVQNEALVFTSCSNRIISLFIASSGTKIKSFFQSSAIMSICRGWGKFYAGLGDGTINVYNWKNEEREFAKIEHPAAHIATVHQGRLHCLVILSSNGNISLRDAETSLLIRSIKAYVKLPSRLTVYNDLAYLSSSDKTLTILDIMTGRAEKKMYLSCNTTGLGVFEDYIFTVSYSGFLNCYSKDRVTDKKIFYGAGRTNLTCIHVYQDWVFTGNRKGDVAVFKFDPTCTLNCQFGTCSSVFGLTEDLEYHLEKDHLMRKKNLARCHWGVCSYVFPPNWTLKDKMQHVIKHIYRNVISIP